jgi:hypothetical protein
MSFVDYEKVKLKDNFYGFIVGCYFDIICEKPIAYENHDFLPLIGAAQVKCPRPADSEDMDEVSGAVRGLVVTKISRDGILRYKRVGFLTMSAWQFRAWKVGVHFEEIIKSRRLRRITVV